MLLRSPKNIPFCVFIVIDNANRPSKLTSLDWVELIREVPVEVDVVLVLPAHVARFGVAQSFLRQNKNVLLIVRKFMGAQ